MEPQADAPATSAAATVIMEYCILSDLVGKMVVKVEKVLEKTID